MPVMNIRANQLADELELPEGMHNMYPEPEPVQGCINRVPDEEEVEEPEEAVVIQPEEVNVDPVPAPGARTEGNDIVGEVRVVPLIQHIPLVQPLLVTSPQWMQVMTLGNPNRAEMEANYKDDFGQQSCVKSLKMDLQGLAEVILIPPGKRTKRRIGLIPSPEPIMEQRPPPDPVKMKFPYFTVILSVLEVFVYNLIPREALVLCCAFSPYERSRAWTYLTTMFPHGSLLHFVCNLSLQLILGILIEVVHHWERVLALYAVGHVFALLFGTIVSPSALVYGSSGGVFSLIGAHAALIVVNGKETVGAPLRFALILMTYFFFEFYLMCIEWVEVCHTGYMVGAMVGLFFGMHIFRPFKFQFLDLMQQKLCIALFMLFSCILTMSGITFQNYYPGGPKYQRLLIMEFENVTIELKGQLM